MRRFGGFGILGLVIVVAIVLYLVAKNYQAVAPSMPKAERQVEELAGPGELPNLGQMEAATSAHAAELEKALNGEETEEP